MTLAINVMAMLIAFVAVVALANYLLVISAVRRFGIAKPVHAANILRLAQRAVRLADGRARPRIAWRSAEFSASASCSTNSSATSRSSKTRTRLEPRSFMLTTYALCGFANFSSIAIQIWRHRLARPRAPGRSRQTRPARHDRSGCSACYLTATIAGHSDPIVIEFSAKSIQIRIATPKPITATMKSRSGFSWRLFRNCARCGCESKLGISA